MASAKEAERLLRDPSCFAGLRELSPHDQQLQLWVRPAFHPYVSWTLYRKTKRKEPVVYWVRRVVWDQRADFSVTFNRAHPPIGADGQISSDVVKVITKQMSTLKAESLFPSTNTAGLDGISYGIQSGSHMCKTEIQWWCEPPVEWPGVLDFLLSTISVFQSVLPQSTVDIDFSTYL